MARGWLTSSVPDLFAVQSNFNLTRCSLTRDRLPLPCTPSQARPLPALLPLSPSSYMSSMNGIRICQYSTPPHSLHIALGPVCPHLSLASGGQAEQSQGSFQPNTIRQPARDPVTARHQIGSGSSEAAGKQLLLLLAGDEVVPDGNEPFSTELVRQPTLYARHFTELASTSSAHPIRPSSAC